jgi:RimJ/RimL family protein N-acetyltransferase
VSALAEHPGPDGAPIRIRPSTAADAPAVLAYLRSVGAESDFLSFGGEGPPVSEAEERVFLARLEATDNALAILAEWNGQIVGYLTFTGGNRLRTRHAGEFGITVAQPFQGIGLGRRMLAMLIDWTREGGIVRKINLLVRCDNDRAIALYESLGFEVEGRKRRDMQIDGVFHDAFLMGLAVDPGDATA